MFRRRSSQHQKVGPAVRQASIKNALAADEVINNASAAGGAGDSPLVPGTNALFKHGGAGGNGGETKEESVCEYKSMYILYMYCTILQLQYCVPVCGVWSVCVDVVCAYSIYLSPPSTRPLPSVKEKNFPPV